MCKKRLDEVVEILDHKRIPVSKKEREMREKIYPYYGAQGIVDFIDDYIFDGSYILVAEDGNNLKAMNEPIVTWATGQFWVNNHAHILGAKEGYDLQYIFYKLLAMDFRGLITGSAQPKLNQENLAGLQLELPDFKEQRAIAKVLSNIDESIRVNNKKIEKLESIVQLIYDYWFTQFDFPDENGKPYRQSGGKMVYSEELKREIPCEWSSGSLGSISKFGKEKTPNSVLTSSNFISTDNMLKNLGGVVESEYLINEGNSFKFEIGDTLFSNIRTYFKKAWFAQFNGGCCADVLVFKPLDYRNRYFLYKTITQDCFFDYVTSGAKGTKMPRGDKEHMKRYPLAIPDLQTIEKFNEIVSPLFELMDICRNANNSLIRLFDWLLPLLMNGQAKIKSDFA